MTRQIRLQRALFLGVSMELVASSGDDFQLRATQTRSRLGTPEWKKKADATACRNGQQASGLHSENWADEGHDPTNIGRHACLRGRNRCARASHHGPPAFHQPTPWRRSAEGFDDPNVLFPRCTLAILAPQHVSRLHILIPAAIPEEPYTARQPCMLFFVSPKR